MAREHMAVLKRHFNEQEWEKYFAAVDMLRAIQTAGYTITIGLQHTVYNPQEKTYWEDIKKELHEMGIDAHLMKGRWVIKKLIQRPGGKHEVD